MALVVLSKNWGGAIPTEGAISQLDLYGASAITDGRRHTGPLRVGELAAR